MIGRLGIVGVVLALWLTPVGALDDALASTQDTASTHAYLKAGYTALHAIVTTWPSVEANIRKLNHKLHTECPDVAGSSPQTDEEQKLAHEVAGALWATGYHTNAGIVRKFVRAVSPLRWSNPKINRDAHNYLKGLQEMVALQVPDLCGDVRVWRTGGYGAVSTTTAKYASHVDAIEVKEIPRNLMRPFVAPADKGLVATDERLALRFEELEVGRGMEDWDTLLETLALNQ
ncbi:MAG TPA: hypothetical protein VGI26_10675 [Solirubrobacteraceae bacterium]|jgi:hypothetical protein